MSYQRIIEKIQAKRFGRSELVILRANALRKLEQGDTDAQAVLDEIDVAQPIDDRIVFMGFCPGATLENRLDVEWKKTDTCTFIFLDSEHQLERFNSIWAGDLIVLKKRHVFGKTMQLHGHGRVTGVKHDEEGNRYLLVDWSSQEEVIEVPLMACNSTYAEYRLAAAVDFELAVDALDVVGHGLVRDAQAVGDLVVGHALGDALQATEVRGARWVNVLLGNVSAPSAVLTTRCARPNTPAATLPKPPTASTAAFDSPTCCRDWRGQ